MTAATFTADSTEFTGYSEATRVAWTAGAIAAGSVSNTASKAVFTITTAGPTSIFGIGQLSASAKSAVTGQIMSVARFSASKSVVATDVLNVTSTLSATSV